MSLLRAPGERVGERRDIDLATAGSRRVVCVTLETNSCFQMLYLLSSHVVN